MTSRAKTAPRPRDPSALATAGAALAWLGAIGGSMYAIHRLARAPGPHTPRRLQRLTLAQLAAGVAMAAVVHRLAPACGPGAESESARGDPPRPAKGKAWVAALAAIEAGHFAVTVPAMFRWRGARPMLMSLGQYAVSVALVEELWFREIWFRICRHRFFPSVVLGSALFGLYHAPRGWCSVLTSTGVGSVFAVARHRGASLATLTLAHGVMDWVNREVIPGARFRLSPTGTAIVFPTYCFLLAYAAARRPRRHEVASLSMIHLKREPASVIRSSTSGSISSSSSLSSSSWKPGLVPMMS